MADTKPLKDNQLLSEAHLDKYQTEAATERSEATLILGSAGSGKTRTLVARILYLIQHGMEPESLVAFTFSRRAARSLKSRLFYATEECNEEFDISRVFVGTIHEYCYKFLRSRPEYYGYEPLDEIGLEALVFRLYDSLDLSATYPDLSFSQSINRFISDYLVFENELLSEEDLPENIREPIIKFVEVLRRNRLLTFGQMIRHAERLIRKEGGVSGLRHLLVDEYQDINPAQRKLIDTILLSGANLTASGDDLQCIYQWRGSDVREILKFEEEFDRFTTHVLPVNYRSKNDIVELGERFSKTISPRADRTMIPVESGETSDRGIYLYEYDSEKKQAKEIVEKIQRLLKFGYLPREISILLRSVKTSGRPIINELKRKGIPFYSPQLNLHENILSNLFVPLFKMLTYETEEPTSPKEREQREESFKCIKEELVQNPKFHSSRLDGVLDYISQWRSEIIEGKREVYDIRRYIFDFFRQLEFTLSLKDSEIIPQIGILTQIVRSVEEIHRRKLSEYPRMKPKEVYKQTLYMLKNMANKPRQETEISHLNFNAVFISTVHQAKGLEWPVVFLPSVVSRRFPVAYRDAQSSFPSDIVERYGTQEADERRLFYVALSRANDYLFVSYFKPRGKSDFINDVEQFPRIVKDKSIKRVERTGETGKKTDKITRISVSDALIFQECPFQYHLRRNAGIYPPVAETLGFGKSLHEIIHRIIDEPTQLTDEMIDEIVGKYTFIPLATGLRRISFQNAIRERVKKLCARGIISQSSQSEVEVNVRFGNVQVSGKIDLVVEDPSRSKPTLVRDWKASISKEFLPRYLRQVQLYSYLLQLSGHNVKEAELLDVKKIYEDDPNYKIKLSVAEEAKNMSSEIRGGLERLSNLDFHATPDPSKCRICDVAEICSERVIND